jgi:hypothetical protein
MPLQETQENQIVLVVREHDDGCWYIGAGRTIAEGPYRRPWQVLAVASDLLASEGHWRIEVFNVSGDRIAVYSSDQMRASDLDPRTYRDKWTVFTNGKAAPPAADSNAGAEYHGDAHN